jgi:hypothetical protein
MLPSSVGQRFLFATRRRALVGAAFALVAAAGCAGDPASPVPAPVTQIPPPLVAPGTTAPTPPLPVWPLTGGLGNPVEKDFPAVAVKVDNSPQARPHAGVNQADLVYELQVEGITRLMEVFHSWVPDRVGPVRSARSSDIDLLFGLGRPLLVWSGGNPGVTDVVHWAHDNGGLNDVGAFSAAGGQYYRDYNRGQAPHNLFANALAIRDQFGRDPVGWPGPILPHALAGTVPPGATPAAGVRIDFGLGVVVEYVWDAERKGWDRFQVDQLHPREASAFTDEGGAQVAPENVVVLFLGYSPDPIESRSPKAESVGSGGGLALMGGTSVPINWRRDTNRDAWNLTNAVTGEPVLLGAGKAWVALPATGQGNAWIIDPGEAAGLLALRR